MQTRKFLSCGVWYKNIKGGNIEFKLKIRIEEKNKCVLCVGVVRQKRYAWLIRTNELVFYLFLLLLFFSPLNPRKNTHQRFLNFWKIFELGFAFEVSV